MKIRDYTLPELEYFRQYCNFTNDELTYFNYKAKDLSNIEISLKMNISTSQVSKLAKRVSSKISRVIIDN